MDFEISFYFSVFKTLNAELLASVALLIDTEFERLFPYWSHLFNISINLGIRNGRECRRRERNMTTPFPPGFPVAFFAPHWWWRKDLLGPHVIDKAMVRLMPFPVSLAAVDNAFNAISGTLVLKLHSDTLVRLNHVTHLALVSCIVNSRWSQDHGRVNPKTVPSFFEVDSHGQLHFFNTLGCFLLCL